jgi:dipeptidyl aminopeptidase/acylaminoacyl peptidase
MAEFFTMRRAVAVAVLTLALPASAVAQKRPITHEDVWLAKRLTGTAVSPDGRWVTVQVTEPAYDERDQSSDLWLIPTDGQTPPRRLTATKGSETGASWSPDSRRIAFSARRDGDDASQ